MIEVGVRQLKNSLSHYLRRIRSGESVLITDRGVPVAQIIPAVVAPRMRKLMAEGRITWSGAKFQPPTKVPNLKPGPSLSSYVSEDRI
ncbi:MAG: type II toxin-antitoxin system Phd/YefM family antitoxin [Actinomycetota bacterium]